MFSNLGERHNRCRILLCGMGEGFQGCERLFVGEIEHALMGLDHLKVEGRNLIEEGLSGSKPRRMMRGIVQLLPDRRGCLCHASLVLS